VSRPLRVLVYGSTPSGVCDFYRTWMFQPYLAELGIELRAWLQRQPPGPAAGEVPLPWADREPLEWADVLLFRRGEQTYHLCIECSFAHLDRQAAANHARASGHAIQWAANGFLRPLWEALERTPRLLTGRGLVYETDDDLLRIPSWNGNRRVLLRERDLMERMVARADLVTVSTPVLAGRLRPFNPRVRVVRNAVDRKWYEAAVPDGDLPGDPRVLYYGNLSRRTQYGACQDAVDEVRRLVPTLRRVWFGAPDDPHYRARVEGLVDEVWTYVVGVPAFAAALVRARPEIGLAPLLGDDFDRARSELHWLEYSMAGAVTVASRTMGGGPYDVIRPGVDGFLVKGKAEWREVLLRLARSSSLRAEVAGRARERVLAEYDARRRAEEWAAAFRWAADHAGIGRLERRLAVSDEALAAVRRRAADAIHHRQRVEGRLEAVGRLLARRRGEGGICGAPRGAVPSLVSVILAAGDPRAAGPMDTPSPSLASAVESVLAGLHQSVEVIVVWPAVDPPPTLPADPRVRRVPLRPGPAGESAAATWARGMNRGLAAARGAWVASLRPDQEYEPHHLALLLEVAEEHGLEAVYGWLVAADGRHLGPWPPDPEAIPPGSELVSAGLSVVRFDPAAHLLGRDPAAERWRRLLSLKIRLANVEAVVVRARQPSSLAA
jgi:glycosyltransferase involved in cell wall biosynthesis